MVRIGNLVVTSRIRNILRCRAKISRKGEGVDFNADLTRFAQLGNGTVKCRAIDTELFRKLTVEVVGI